MCVGGGGGVRGGGGGGYGALCWDADACFMASSAVVPELLPP